MCSTELYGVVLVSKLKFDMHSNMLCKAIGKMWNLRSASCADSANQSAPFDLHFHLQVGSVN